MPSPSKRIHGGVRAPGSIDQLNHASAETTTAAKTERSKHLREQKKLVETYGSSIDIALRTSGLSPEEQSSARALLEQPIIKQEIITRAGQMRGENQLPSLVAHALENAPSLKTLLNERLRSLNSIKGKRTYWQSQLSKEISRTNHIDARLKGIKQRIKALEKEERALQKARVDLDISLLPNSPISTVDVRTAPANDDEEEFDIESIDTTPHTPTAELLKMHGIEPPVIVPPDETSFTTETPAPPDSDYAPSFEPTRVISRPPRTNIPAETIPTPVMDIPAPEEANPSILDTSHTAPPPKTQPPSEPPPSKSALMDSWFRSHNNEPSPTRPSSGLRSTTRHISTTTQSGFQTHEQSTPFASREQITAYGERARETQAIQDQVETPSDNLSLLQSAWDTYRNANSALDSLLAFGVPKKILEKYSSPDALLTFVENPGLWARINGSSQATLEALNRFIEAASATRSSTLHGGDFSNEIRRRQQDFHSSSRPKGLV